MVPTLETDLRGCLPDSLRRIWRRRGVDTLLPLQRRAVRDSGLFAGRNLLVLAPSSSGKTLIAEFAMARALASGRRAIFLSPTRALAEQQFAALQPPLADLGLRAICSTSDRPESDIEAAAGRFDVLVAVYEKLRAFLATDSRLLAGVGAVAVDEIQTLGDPQRGPGLDLLLTQLLRSPYAPQLVGLGPALSRPAFVADWLGAELVESDERPRPLREGVLVSPTGSFHYRPANGERTTRSFEQSEREGWATPARLESRQRALVDAARGCGGAIGEDASALLAVAVEAATRGPALFFVPTRRCSWRWTRLIAAMDEPFAPARVALAALEQTSAAGRVRHRLGEALAAGVAFHNADLSSDLRALVEAAFESGEVRLLISTPTLGTGVNLSARTVLHTPWRLGSALELAPPSSLCAASGDKGAESLASVALPLDRSRFTQQGGRAARLGFGDRPGDSMLVARSEEEARRYWEHLIAAPPEALERPPLAAVSVEETALGLLAGGIRRTARNLAEAFASTYSGRLYAETKHSIDTVSFETALHRLESRGLVRRGEHALWGLTGLGETALRASLRPSTIRTLEKATEEASESEAGMDDPAAECRLLFRLALTPEGELATVSLPFTRRRPPFPVPEGMDADAEAGALPAVLQRGGGLASAEVCAWCSASALFDWSRGMETPALEEKYDVDAGSLAGAAEAFARLVLAAANLARVLDFGIETASRFGALADRLIHGVDVPGLALARLRVPGLSRDAITRLVGMGWENPAAVSRLPVESLEEAVGADVARRLQAASSAGPSAAVSSHPETHPIRRRIRGPTDSSRFPPRDIPSGRGSAPPFVEINLQSPGIVRALGHEVRLPPLGFDLLVALAERPGEVVTRASLYHRLWPDGGPEDQQLDAHRRRLVDRLRPALGPEARRVGEVVRGVGFRLALDQSRVRIHRESPSRRESPCATRAAPG